MPFSWRLRWATFPCTRDSSSARAWRHDFAISSGVRDANSSHHAPLESMDNFLEELALSAPCSEDIWCLRVSVLASFLSRQFCSTRFHGCPTVEMRCFGTYDRGTLTEPRDGALFQTSFVPRVIQLVAHGHFTVSD